MDSNVSSERIAPNTINRNSAGVSGYPLLVLAIAIAFYLGFVFLTSDVRSAFMIGGDDGLELSKAALLERKPAEAAQMWNDQPWLHTMLTASAFRHFGEKAWIPRLFSTLSALLIIGSLNCYYRKTLSLGALVVMDVMLLSADEFSYMAFAGMTELPALSLATAATLAAATGAKRRGICLLCAAGFVYALAVQIKFTALVLALPMICCCFLGKNRDIWRNLLTLGVAVLLGTAALIAMSPAFNFAQLWSTHSDARRILSILGTDYSPKQIYFWQNPAVLIAGLVGIFSLYRSGLLADLAIPLSFLASAAAFALLQRPWWKWYFMQFEIPMAILAAYGIDCLWSIKLHGLPRREDSGWVGGARRTVMALVLASWCGFALPAYLKSVGGLYNRHVLEDKDVVRAAKLYREAAHAEWCYSLNNELVFASGLLLPPADVVLSIKRALVTGVSSKTIADNVRNANLPLLMLRKDNELKTDAWLSWVTNRYEFVTQGAATELWVSKTLPKAGSAGALKASVDARLKYIYF